MPVAIPPGLAFRVRVPASSANLGPAFDSMALALDIVDEYELTTLAAGLVIEVYGESAERVPKDERHLVYRSMCAAWRRLGTAPPPGLRLVAHNRVPHGRGLGSSATAVVAGVLAAVGLHDTALGGGPAPDRGLVAELASAIEGHPDNATASVYGGLTLSFYDDTERSDVDSADEVHQGGRPPRLRTVQVPCVPSLRATVAIPVAELSTALARAVLPARVAHADAALNAARVGLLVHAVSRDPMLLLPATRDWLHQEQRRTSFPSTMALVDALRARGLPAMVSGAGPSVLVLSDRPVLDEVGAVLNRLDRATWTITEPGIATTPAMLYPAESTSVPRDPPAPGSTGSVGAPVRQAGP